MHTKVVPHVDDRVRPDRVIPSDVSNDFNVCRGEFCFLTSVINATCNMSRIDCTYSDELHPNFASIASRNDRFRSRVIELYIPGDQQGL